MLGFGIVKDVERPLLEEHGLLGTIISYFHAREAFLFAFLSFGVPITCPPLTTDY